MQTVQIYITRFLLSISILQVSGIELTNKLAGKEGHPPIIMMSTDFRPDTILKALASWSLRLPVQATQKGVTFFPVEACLLSSWSAAYQTLHWC